MPRRHSIIKMKMRGYGQYMHNDIYARCYGDLAAERSPGAAEYYKSNVYEISIERRKWQGYRPKELAVYLLIASVYKSEKVINKIRSLKEIRQNQNEKSRVRRL